MASIPTVEAGTTIQFTWTSSESPDDAPNLSIFDKNNTLVHSALTVQSDTLHYYGLYTTPNTSTIQYMMAQWTAVKTFVSSPYTFVNRLAFRVVKTKALT